MTGFPSMSCDAVIGFECVAFVLAVDLPELVHIVLLPLALHRVLGKRRIDEIIKARQALHSILTAELVEARNAALAVADEIQRRDVQLARLAAEPRHRKVLQEHRVIVQRQRAESLAAHREGPVRETAVVHRRRRARRERSTPPEPRA